MRGHARFGQGGKLNPRYISHYPVIAKVGAVAYRLGLPSELDNVHDVFHISMIRKYVVDPSYMIQPQELEFTSAMRFRDEPLQIVDQKIKKVRTKEVPLVKVVWRSQGVSDMTWEPEAEML
ncbi:PREDICTED: uncharacterized protein LOC109116461 [Tarenaya hassleriana]|uniref:uncharacterized protein LOC109116461 n=1 Tax=Tarenaya hassleriana TaxID=28532 RepID=UPI0008FD0B4B|nr:PREDICTED: uncharacterized protein LOC109116461 [Tarenaya hassleriana]